MIAVHDGDTITVLDREHIQHRVRLGGIDAPEKGQRYSRAARNELARQVFAAWMAPFHDFGMRTVAIQSLGSTDHISFDSAGLPGFQFIQDRIPGTGGHTNLDFFDTIQAADLMKNAVVMASFAWHAAMSDERVPRKTLR